VQGQRRVASESFSGMIAAMPGWSSNAYYAAEVAGVLRTAPEEIVGALVSNSSFSAESAQRDAWLLGVRRAAHRAAAWTPS